MNTPHIKVMNFDFRNEMWLYVLGGLMLAAVAVGIAFLLVSNQATGLNIP